MSDEEKKDADASTIRSQGPQITERITPPIPPIIARETPFAIPSLADRIVATPIDRPAIRPLAEGEVSPYMNGAPVTEPLNTAPPKASYEQSPVRAEPIAQERPATTRREIRPIEAVRPLAEASAIAQPEKEQSPDWTLYEVTDKKELFGTIAKELGVGTSSLKEVNGRFAIMDLVARQGEKLEIPVTYETDNRLVEGKLSDLIGNPNVRKVINASEEVAELIDKNMPNHEFEVHKASEGYRLKGRGAEVLPEESETAVAASDLPRGDSTIQLA